jgi:cytochrome c biogenesis protein CcdA
MTRRSSRRTSRRVLETRAPRKTTLIIASALYILGLFGALGWFPALGPFATILLAIAGGLLILGALLRGL